jgi:hypothetical protein
MVIAGTQRINEVRVFGSLAEFAGRFGFRKLSCFSLRVPFAIDITENAARWPMFSTNLPLKTLCVYVA